MKKYKSIFKEKRYETFKAWFNIKDNFWYIFDIDLYHSDVAKEKLDISEDKALKSKYIRITNWEDGSLNIETYFIPSNKEFKIIQSKLKSLVYLNKIENVFWDIIGKSYRFPKTSFFISSKSINDGEKIR